MREQKNRLARPRAVIANDDVALVGARPALEDVRRRKPGVEKSFGDRVGRGRRVPDGVRGVDLDQLFIDVVRELLVRRQTLRRQQRGKGDRCKGGNGQTHRRLQVAVGCVEGCSAGSRRPEPSVCRDYAPIRFRMSRAPAATPMPTPPPNSNAVPPPTNGNEPDDRRGDDKRRRGRRGTARSALWTAST